MSHTAYSDGDVELDADFVVVGSGAGGSAAALTLARGGASVVLVEAGAWRDPDHYPVSVYGAMRDLMDDWGSTITRGRALWPVVQASAVGGTTVINSAISVTTPGDIFAQWRDDYGVGDAEFERNVLEHETRIESELSVNEVPPPSLGRSNELAILADERLGYGGHVMRRYAKDCEGTGQCLQGCKKGRKQSTNLAWIPEVMERGGHVVSCAPVKRVRFEGGRAVGVTGRFKHPSTRRRGGTFELRAKRGVVIAASATHSPALLQRSGVKLPALGKYFRAHPGTGVMGLYDEVVDMNIGATQGWASTKFRESPGLKLETLSIPPELVASRVGGGGKKLMARLAEYRHMAMWVHAVRAESTGTVSNGMFDKPVVKYTLDRADMERLRRGIHFVASMHFSAGAKRVVPFIHGFAYDIGPDELDTLLDAPLEPRSYVAILSHLFGGCAMGRDRSSGVCDATGKVFDCEGLYVADASVIPTNLGVNPQHTIMGLASHFAERWL
ncbi:MAG: GMC family oxidoreductase [Deltaproteobacteria bacterium]|jgi:choline dehydrogenase-like flavoprotein